MTDNELRGIVLKMFYDRRHDSSGAYVNLRSLVASDSSDDEWTQTANICEQLAGQGLLTWKRIPGPGGIAIDGMGKITATGVDVIEGVKKVPTVSVDNSVHVHGSTGVQIGEANKQGNITTTVDIEKLISAVDHSTASDGEKAKAKSLLRELIENPLTKAVLSAAGVMLSGGSAH